MVVVVALGIYTLSFVLVAVGIFIASKNENSFVMKGLHVVETGFSVLMPGFVKRFLTSCRDYLLYSRNPLLQVLYSVLMIIGYGCYTITAYRYVNETWYGQLPYILLGVNVFVFSICSWVNPGVVNNTNVDKYVQVFSYDGYMYHEKRFCETCCIEKPARSKHCGICDRCVARFDHHCSWVNNCIGQHNHKYFILFLLTLVIITCFSSFLVVMVFIHIVDTRRLHLSTFTDSTGEIFQASLSTLITFLIGEYAMMSFLLMYLVLLFMALGCFLCFHLFLVITNRTTNEICKGKKLKSISYEYEETSKQSTTRNRRGRQSRHASMKQRFRLKPKEENSRSLLNHNGFFFGVYSRGLIQNIFEVLAG